MKKYKTLNNCITQRIIDNLITENYRAVFYLLYNCGDELEADVFGKTLNIIVGWFDKDLDRMDATAKELCGNDVYAFMFRVINLIREKYDKQSSRPTA